LARFPEKTAEKRMRICFSIAGLYSTGGEVSVLSCVEASKVKMLILIKQPYGFDSGTRIPCLTTNSNITKSMTNIGQTFNVVKDFTHYEIIEYSYSTAH
jgi:hypothetical protein